MRRGATVLIVDDDASFRSAARTLFTARGYEVVGEADSADAGLAVASASCPDAVLLDVHLPDGDGLAVAARLAAGGPRVLLTSTDPTAVPAHLVRSSGAVGFVPKEDLADAALDSYFMG